ncbi:hypothetical protein [Rhizobium sp. BK602]|uniref:hypothetical protein n=1 Tax=Rhizobium sp. BK602 TaxID=2586986 RepID=UPI001617029C|nr:hypothetical protein [Rhizobium sp. BK602]MBB3612092.1 hypothetical protein [Rhizobium sp. BK602]
MAWDVKNNWPDIAELRIDNTVTDSNFSTETEFKLELYTSSYELNLEDRRVLVGFHRITLQLECLGTDIALGERYGDSVPPDLVTKTAIQSDTSTKAKVGGGFTLDTGKINPTPTLNVSVGAEASHTSTLKSETSQTTITKHVTAKPNGKWEISSHEKQVPLSAKYLTKENALCVIRPKEGANQTGVQAYLYAHKHDIVLTSQDEQKSRFSLINGENKNKEKISKILLGKLMEGGKEGLDRNSYIELSIVRSFNPDV